MANLSQLTNYYELNVMKRADLPGKGLVTYSASPEVDAQFVVNHGLGYVPFFIAGADIFRNGVIWSNEYLFEWSYSALGTLDQIPRFSYWCSANELTINLRNGGGTNQQSGDADVFYAVYIDYKDVPVFTDDLSMISEYSQDKIVAHDIVKISNDGNTSGQTGTWQVSKIVERVLPNPYGRAALARARWSLDGGSNWFPLEQKRLYTFTVDGIFTLFGLGEGISIGCSDDSIFIRTANGRHGNVTTPSSYTPTPRDFLIEYWLYERE